MLEINFEALSALSISDLLAIRTYHIQRYSKYHDKVDDLIYRAVTKEYLLRISNLFIV